MIKYSIISYLSDWSFAHWPAGHLLGSFPNFDRVLALWSAGMPISGLYWQTSKGKERKKSKEADLETCWSHHRGFSQKCYGWCYGYGIDIFVNFFSIFIFVIYLDSYQAVIRGALRQQTAFTLVLLAMERLMMILM